MLNGQFSLRRVMGRAAALSLVLTLVAVGLGAQTSTFSQPPMNLSQTTSTTSSFPEIGIDAKGNFNLAWVDSAKGVVFSRSTDQGAHFLPVTVPGSTSAAFQPQVVVDFSGNIVYVAWAAPATPATTPPNYDVFVSRSTSGGTTGSFSVTPAKVSGTTPVPLADGPRMALNPTGGIVVVWGRTATFMSQGDGVTFSPTPIQLSAAPPPGQTTPQQDSGGPRVAVDSKGTIYVVWTDELNKSKLGSYCLEKDTQNTAVFNNTLGGNVYFNKTDKGATPSALNTRNLSNTDWKGVDRKYLMGFFGCSYDNLMLIMDSSDNLHLVWSDDLPDEDILVSAYPYIDPVTLTKTFAFPRNLAEAAAASPHAVIDQSSVLHVVWSGGPTGPAGSRGIFYSHSTDSNAPFGLTFVKQTRVVAAGASPGFPQIGVDPSGNINAAWQQSDASGGAFDVLFARSFDTGATFLPANAPAKVSANPSTQCLGSNTTDTKAIPPPPYTTCGSVQMRVDSGSNADIVWVDRSDSKANSDILFSRGTITAPDPPPGDFSLTLAPPSQTSPAGGTAAYTVNLTAINGFSQPVTVACTQVPVGATCSSPAPVNVFPGSATITVHIPSALAPGTYSVRITGTSGTTSHFVDGTLVVTAVPPGDFSVTIAPSSQTSLQGATDTFTVSVGSSGGFNKSVNLSCTGALAGATCTINPAAVTAPGSASVTLAVAGTVAPGTYPFTITGTNGSTSHSQQAQITVGALTTTISPGTSATINVGGSASFTVSLSSTNGASGPVSLGCAGVAAGLRCTVSPAQVTVPASGSITSTLTVAVDVKPAASSVGNGSPGLREITRPCYLAAWSLAFAVLLFMTAAMVRISRREDAGPVLTVRGLAMLALVIVLAAGLVSCGGTASSSGSGNGGVGGGGNPVTTQFDLQGQSGTATLHLSTMSITVP